MQLNTEELELISEVTEKPAISIILPLAPKAALKAETEKNIKLAIDKVRKQLKETYPPSYYASLLERLEEVPGIINYESPKHSIAIFVSPSLTKTFDLDIPVEEKIVINGSFEIRDLVYAKQSMVKYIALFINAKQAKAFLSDNGSMAKLNLNIPDHLAAYENDIAEPVTNFSDNSSRKEILLDRFLKHIDDALTQILRSYRVPVFLIGVDKVLGHFKSISHNNKNIVASVHGNYQELTLPQIHDMLQPHVNDWKNKETAALLSEIEKAANAHRLVSGIQAVSRAAKEKNGRLLIVEKNFVYPAKTIALYVKDAVDEIIEEVIKSGGEVRFTDEGQLADYNRIALIRYY